jgi:hypothetical protein
MPARGIRAPPESAIPYGAMLFRRTFPRWTLRGIISLQEFENQA